MLLAMDQSEPLDYGKWAAFFERMRREYSVIVTLG
jgi:hypothetical protein